ncbi:spermidine/putrescine ABC transporter permease/substrate-binding protein [Spiroplasma sp. BIUS-1]|uniref:spermidine/putrescine ABC transporter permease/substrate-binding protein n=1 Tax=Spiroplasma sp. BIUS-1 TaxID=216964 RepID=UPI001397E390|nr:spermidine/putrescine ABC transporter permease/substrate-binding protein [Spiroplasma sp. BIUS-1]QHX36381.1 spermidine/putrescine ABC transporter permease [Spiroplasma sp. BIUS-1]
MKKFFKSSYFLIMMLFIYVPVAVMIAFSFNAGNSTSSWSGFSFEWYSKLINNSPFMKSITVSLFVAMVSTILSLIIGMMAVVGLTKIRPKAARNWVRIANIPLVNADVITAVGLMLLFVLAGVKFGIVTLIAAHVSFNVPYVIITVLPFMNRIDKNVLEASKDLGGNQRQTFYKVILPILTPCIVTAAAICFAMSFDDFIISYFTGGGQTNVSTFIYTAKRMQPYINAFGTLLVAFIVFVILIWNIVQFSIQRSKDIKVQIKKGTYKIKVISKLENEIKYLEKCLSTGTKVDRTKNLKLLAQYKLLKFQIKILNNKNNNKKISKLEWKKELISSEIKLEKRYFTIFQKLNLKKTQIENKMKTMSSEKKARKFEQVLLKLERKINKYEKEIEWINERNEIDKERSMEIGQQVLDLKSELESLENPSSKIISWYNKKIKTLSFKRDCLLEGRNQYKLRITIEKLAEMRKENLEKSEAKYQQLKDIEQKVFRKISLVESIDLQIKNLDKNSAEDAQKIKELTSLRESKLQEAKNNLEKKLTTKENQLQKINDEVKKKKDKYFPDVLTEDYVPKSNRWIKRNWKQLTMGTALLGSFSLLTTAYVMNNIYDLVIGNWGSYIDPELITEFEKETGYKVNYQQYDSNESLYNKTYTFNYDLMVPSDYMVQKLATEGALQRIDWCRVENINTPKGVHMDQKCDELPESTLEAKELLNYNESLEKLHGDYKFKDAEQKDSNLLDYSIPWFWGDVRIVFNLAKFNENTGKFEYNEKLKKFLQDKKIISKEENKDNLNMPYKVNNENLSWNILWEAANEGFNLALNEDPKNVFMYGFQKLYGTVEAKDELKIDGKEVSKQKQVDEVSKEIEKLVSGRNVGLYGDQLIDKVHDRDFDIAVMYNGDLIYAMQDDYESEVEEDSLKRDEQNQNINNFKFDVISGVPGAKMSQKVIIGDKENTNESTNLWSDNLVISSTNRHMNATYDFINFIYEIESQKALVDETGMPTGFKEVIDYAQKKGDEWKEWFEPSKNGFAFNFDEKIDNYLVDKFNKIISTKH